MSSGSDSETPLVGRATEEPLLVVRATTLRDEVRDELLAYSELSASPPASASPEPAPAPPTTSGRWSGLRKLPPLASVVDATGATVCAHDPAGASPPPSR